MNNYIIYIHKNKVNGKIYVGQTCQSPIERWGLRGQRYKGQIFYKAIEKYGWDNFEHIILETHLSKEEANEKEKYYIKLYNTTNKLFGYNISSGGNNNNLSNTQKEQRKQMNYKMWADGTFKNLINKSVYCVELDEYFESALNAERKYGIDNSAIQKVCKGKLKYSGIKNGQPLHWLYSEDVTEEKIKKLKNKTEILKGIGIPVYCIELQQTFPSAAEAGRQLNIDPSSIRKVIKGQKKTSGGFHWKTLQNQINIGNFK